MRDYKLLYSLSKDCVIVDGDLETKAFQFITKVTKLEEPSVIGSLSQNKKSIVFTVLATSVMLMLLIAITIMLIRIRIYNKKKED
jgi:hypothetical protein